MNQALLKEESQPSPADVQGGVGVTLKSLREAKRLSLSEVSGRLKFSARQIEMLENEQWDNLPRGVPLRGMVRNYGRFLETDVDSLLVMFDHQASTGIFKPVVLKNSASLGRADLPVQAEATSRPWGWLIVILILLFVAGFYAIDRSWVPDSWLVFDWLKNLKK
jgi:cytoskeletal protein RodZ